MSTITKERVANLLQFNSEGSDCQANAEQWEVHELARIALASLEADGTLTGEGTITATQFKPVADLYEVTVPGGRSTTFTKDAAEASDCRVMGWSVQEYVKLERYQSAMLQGAEPVTTDKKLPEGYVLVPVEPTPEMREAYHQAQGEYEDVDGLWSPDHQWQAMLAAAPQQEVK